MAEFPPEPWDLRGQLHASVFLVPVADLPLELPVGWKVLRILGRAVVGAAWVSYEPPGVLAYRELMATALVHRGPRVAVHIVRIWVDSEASRDGGRALWAIPKDLASFEFRGEDLSAWDEKGGIALATVRPRLRLPGRLPARFSVVQQRDGTDTTAVVTPVSARGGLAISTAAFDPDTSGPLGFLTDRRAWITLSLRDFVMSFGHNGVR